jgi:hypothetical protein
MDEIIKKIPKVGKIYKTVEEAYNALRKGFRSIQKREPNAIEDQMIKVEAEGKIKSQGDNISILPQDKQKGIVSQASGTKKPDLDRPFVTEDEMSAFTLEDNARKLNKAKGFIDRLGAKTSRQKLFVADLVEDASTGIFKNVDMGAVVRSNMFDDLIEQGIDDDLLTKIMYSDTKSDNFGTTLAKIKSNAMDEGADIGETVDFYERVFDEVARVKKAMGGRIGYADGPDDPKKKSFIKKIPKVGKVVSGLESLKSAIGKIMNRFGEDAIITANKAPQPPKTIQQQISEFEARNPNPKRQLTDDEIRDYEAELGDSETWMMDGTVGEAEKALKDRREFIADMELEYKKGKLDPGPGEKGRKEFLQSKMDEMEMSGDKRLMTQDEIDELSTFDIGTELEGLRSLGANKLAERFELKDRIPGIDDELLTNIIEDPDPQHKAEVIATLEEAFSMLKKGKGTDEVIDILEQAKKTRKDNAQGGLNYLMGL